MDKKALSFPILLSLVVGNMIGTGIYVLPATLAEYGTLSILAWVFTSIGAVFLAITFANLNKRYPKTGGPYAFCSIAFGKPAGFIIAYTYWISYLASTAGVAVASISYLGFITPILNAGNPAYAPNMLLFCELVAVWLFTLINIIGLHTAGVVQLFLTVVKIIPLVVIIFIGAAYIHLDHFTQSTLKDVSTFSAIGDAAAITFWAFIGLESATVPAENTPNYHAVYKATVLGTGITALIYILSTTVLMGMIPANELKTSQFPFALAATTLFGSHAAVVLALCAVLSGLGTLNVGILIQGQIVFAAARDRLFPVYFTKLTKQDVPIAGQLLSSTLVSLFLIVTMEASLLEQFNNIILIAALLTLITYFVSMLAEVKFLMQKSHSLYSTFLSKEMLVAMLAGAYAIWIILSLDIKIILIGLLLMLVCIPIYFLFVRKYAENITQKRAKLSK